MCHADGTSHKRGAILGSSLFGVANFHLVHLSLAHKQRRINSTADGIGIDGGRHHHNLQVGAQELLHFTHKGECDVGGKATLMKLVEDDGTDAIERGVIYDHSGENALGDNFNASVTRHFGVEAHTIAHRFAHAFANH